MPTPDQSELRRGQPTKLERIREQLNRPDISIVGEVVINYDPPHRGFYQIVEIYVSPREPIWIPKDLTRFTNTLVDLKRSGSKGASEFINNFYFPYLDFIEAGGTEIRRTVRKIQIEETGIDKEIETASKEMRLKRKITIRAYPHSAIAELVYVYKKALSQGKVEENREFNRLIDSLSMEAVGELEQGRDPFKDYRDLLTPE